MATRRLLLLLPSVPLPPDAGAKLRNLGLLRAVRAAGDWHVEAIAFGAAHEQAALDALTRRAGCVVPPPRRPARRRVLDLLAGRPDMAVRGWSPAFAAAVEAALRDRPFDLVQAEGIEMAPYLARVPAERRVYDAHNAEFLLQRRAGELGGSLAGRLYSRLQWRRLERFERALVRHSRLVLAVSEHDANQLLALAGGQGRVRVVPNGIQVADHPFRLPKAEAAPNLLLLGKLDFRPNGEAARWLIETVLPGLFAQVPQARLFCVGAAPPDWLVRAGQHDARLAVTGYVEDERPYLRRAMALLLPLRLGGGTRLKALVAMASGVPIVSTHLGMEGLEAVADEHYLAAEAPAEWTHALRCLADDAALRQRLALAARSLVEQRYDWRVLAPRLLAAYAEVLGRGTDAPGGADGAG
jgi:polysaccharide biosynthesis protein PslH